MGKEEIMSLSEVKENREAIISSIEGDTRFMSRITSIGLTPGCKVNVVKNDKNRPILVYSRDTMIALNRNECKGIMVEEVAV
jgi:ferrous iron transport protein A